ncbi:MAG: hypothetical protein QY311_00495 [Candidatus Paceibacterota bacterium]|nr:MAG: hypothetical protein QY311_00495 [Candidatus Paceibacterota bacterium]
MRRFFNIATASTVFGLFAVVWFLQKPDALGVRSFDIQSALAFDRVFSPTYPLDADNMRALLMRAEELLKEAPISIGELPLTYAEQRIVNNGSGPVVVNREFTDVERQLALAVLDKKSGEISVIPVIKRGADVVAPDGYRISIAPRANGIAWNYWATQFVVEEPKHRVVIMTKFPLSETVRVGRATDVRIEPVLYTAYTEELSDRAFFEAGARYIADTVAKAREDLRAQGVQSRAVPGKLVVDVLPVDVFQRIPFLEQGDLLEVLVDAEYVARRILGTLGYNGARAFAHTESSAGARGWLQFTDNKIRTQPGTYTQLRRLYPKALLEPDFEKGASDHLNSMKAAILLHDENLAYFIRNLGESILSDPRLEEYLAAAYNGPPARALSAIREAKQGEDWIAELASETQGFITKLRIWKQYRIPDKYL